MKQWYGFFATLLVVAPSTTSPALTHRTDRSDKMIGNGLHVSIAGTRNAGIKNVAASEVVADESVFGIVSNLQITEAGNRFDLIAVPNQTLHLETTASTTVTNSSEKSVATLTEGQRVKVYGTYDASNAVFSAATIVVHDQQSIARQFGTVTNLQTTDGSSTFTLQGEDGDTTESLSTAVTTITNFSDNSTATLAKGQEVHVSGSYDEATQTLTVTSIVVNDHRAPAPNQSVQGAIVSLDAASKTFVVSVRAARVHVTATTVIVTATSSTALTHLSVGTKVRAEGTFDATTQTLTATKVVMER